MPDPEPEPLPDWRVPQVFEPATSYAVRTDLEKLIKLDLLGPWGGDSEEFDPRQPGPLERYLVGRLGPRHDLVHSLDEADEIPEPDLAGDNDPSDPDPPEKITAQAGRLWPSSMGLSFLVSGETDIVAVTASWGRYGKSQSLDDDGNTRNAWSREPVHVPWEVRLDGDLSLRKTAQGGDSNGVFLRAEIRPVTAPDGSPRRFVELSLVNGQVEPKSNKDTAWLLQPQLTVTALDGGSAVFLPIDDPLEDVKLYDADPEEKHLRLLYRNVLKFADGRNVAVHPEVVAGARRASKLTTTWLPTFDVPGTIAPSIKENPQLAGLELSMDALAMLDPAQLVAGLGPLVEGYKAWLDEREAESATLPDALKSTASIGIGKARAIADRLAAGINLLTDVNATGHPDALAAFRFANEAMALQRRHSAIGALRETRGFTYPEAEAEVAKKGAEGASWRPFQLAFVLLNLPALTVPTHPERATGADALVDLLFFPTGGGKTEAYLGLAAYTFAIRRLQGVIGTGETARSGDAGVAVLMRYTLRLLTAQQFQRAAALVCAAEVLRRKDEQRWGVTPFRIGLWVGAGVSPNWYDEAAEEIAKAKDAGKGNRVKVLQTLSCPWCGEKLRGHEDLVPDEDARRILLYCANGEGEQACPFSRVKARGEGLPILTVDEEIYRYAPALVIATVDKLAQLPWRGFAGMLFGRVYERCPRHGYRHADLDTKIGCGSKHHAKGKTPAVVSEPVVRLRPPDLIIQDELHLISGALGTMVGLFEAAVDEMCTWQALVSGGVDGGGAFINTGPKIVASTATTKRAADQVKRLFARKLAIFPPQVLDVTDTFFSRQVPVTEESPGRRYLGVCAHGVRLKAAEIRLADILLIAGQTLFDRHGEPADPYLTLVGYFNATRELAGMRRLLDDDVTNRIRRTGRQRGLSDRLPTLSRQLEIAELTSRISSADITEALKRLESGFDQELETTARLRAINESLKAAAKDKRFSELGLPNRSRPVDVVLATSMLQVGVDVSRFGLMVVTGQPKNTAEYIQASSRVGRDSNRPGLVVTLYNWSRPRDLAHYEDFEHYHATFYRQVEALSVTPYARRALDRGTAATYVAAVRHATDGYSRNHDAQDVDLDGEIATRIGQRFLDRALAADGPRGRDYFAERIAAFRDRWKKAKTSGSSRLGYDTGSYQKQPMRALLEKATGAWSETTVGASMRETENEINLLVPGSKADLLGSAYGVPAWSFASHGTGSSLADADAPSGDEFGGGNSAGDSSDTDK